MSEQTPSKSKLRDGVYQSVRAHLLRMTSEIDKPIRIREEEVARQLGVSRTPVREAFLLLGQEGFLNLQVGRGAFLMPVTHEEYMEWLQLREELEAFAARQAALNASKHDVDRLRAIFAPFDASNLASHVVEYAAANVQFHAAIVGLAANSLLMNVWKSFGLREMLKYRTIEKLNRAHDSFDEHHALIDAIEARDENRAYELARQHVHGLYVQAQQSNIHPSIHQRSTS